MLTVSSLLVIGELMWLKLSDLPLEMLERILMTAFLLILYASGFVCHDHDHRPVKFSQSRHAEWTAFSVLASVCSSWHLTLIGWPQSPTRHWVRHRLKKLTECARMRQQAGKLVLREYFVFNHLTPSDRYLCLRSKH